MDLHLALSVVVLIVGLVLYRFAPGDKAQQVGRIMFAAGLLATLLEVGHLPLHAG